ncbi:MAG: energy transducer TonB [Bacteroidales bacterium]|nr:energy transducer TonB [Bacteroidales bacterium]
MISYKTPQADLEIKKGLFFEIGLVISLLLVYLVFELKTPNRARDTAFKGVEKQVIEEVIINTRQPEIPLPTQPPVQHITVLTLVENTEETPDLIVEAGIDQNTMLPEYVPVVRSEPEERIVEPDFFLVVEEQPSFPGGEAARLKFFAKNIVYPQQAKEFNITGTVYVGFIVEPDGSLSNIKVLRGIGGGCDEEATRVVENMPLWNPGKQRGRPVRVQFTVAVRFTLL